MSPRQAPNVRRLAAFVLGGYLLASVVGFVGLHYMRVAGYDDRFSSDAETIAWLAKFLGLMLGSGLVVATLKVFVRRKLGGQPRGRRSSAG